MKRTLNIKTMLLGLAMVFVATSAFAIPMATYTLNVSDGHGSGPFANVILSQTGTNTVTVEVDMFSGYAMMQAGKDKPVFAFNLNMNGTPTVLVNNPGKYSFMGVGSYNENYFGTFEDAIDSKKEHNVKYYGSNVLNFTVTAAGLTIASFEEFSTGTNHPGNFAMHIFSDNEGATFTVSNGPSHVPEPMTLLLLGLGIAGLAGVRKLEK